MLPRGFSAFSRKYLEILRLNGIEPVEMSIDQPDFWERVRELDCFIFDWEHHDAHRQLARSILPVVEHQLGVRCFPDQATSWHYDDKIRQYYMLRNAGFPVIDTQVFWSREQALAWLETAELPLVFKLRNGAGSANVRLLRSRAEARALATRMFTGGLRTDHMPGSVSFRFRQERLGKFLERSGKALLERMGLRAHKLLDWQRQKNYVIFQRFLDGNEYDTRVVVIGDRALAVRRRNRKDDFRASGSGLLEYAPEDIDPRFLKTAFAVSGHFGFQSMAYDFLLGPGGEPALCEISYRFPHGAFLYDCPGYWDSALGWHPGHNWPQYFQLVDLLGDPSLEQPARAEA
jgi:glutathione synthase/RimK-type ligase-like ATP-grasp enzyme